jgi:predicted GIY-YIG superfamily endonuclease
MDNSPRFVYLLNSTQDPDHYYVGLTSDPNNRLAAQDEGASPHAARYKPWRLVVMIEFTSAQHALAFERYLKTGSGREFSRRHFR